MLKEMYAMGICTRGSYIATYSCSWSPHCEPVYLSKVGENEINEVEERSIEDIAGVCVLLDIFPLSLNFS